MTAIITGTVLFLVAVCGTAIGCGIVRIVRIYSEWNARQRLIEAKKVRRLLRTWDGAK